MLVAIVVDMLTRAGWQARVEVTYSEYGERGSFDILAWHEPSQTLLVIEVKTDLPSAESTLRKLDEKTRLASKVASEGLGWRAASVARLLVMPEESTLRRRVARHSRIFDAALPDRGVAIRSWLRSPAGTVSGLWFLSSSTRASGIQPKGGRSRVRRPRSSSASSDDVE